MADEREREVSRLQEICAGIIEELAAMGGEQALFAHYRKTVTEAAERHELEDLMQIWSDLRDWSRVLSPKQREQLDAGLRRRFGVSLIEDDSGNLP
jgi:hypothetical protein